METADAATTSVSGVSTVSNMPDDFARGVDLSAVIALEKSGVTYSYLDGTSSDDIFEILAGAGVNYVRIRIWNNPYDSSSPYKGYGAGNYDLFNAKVLGKRAISIILISGQTRKSSLHQRRGQITALLIKRMPFTTLPMTV